MIAVRSVEIVEKPAISLQNFWRIVTILDIWNFSLSLFFSLCRRCRSWKNLHFVQIQWEQLQYDIYINNWWVWSISSGFRWLHPKLFSVCDSWATTKNTEKFRNDEMNKTSSHSFSVGSEMCVVYSELNEIEETRRDSTTTRETDSQLKWASDSVLLIFTSQLVGCKLSEGRTWLISLILFT